MWLSLCLLPSISRGAGGHASFLGAVLPLCRTNDGLLCAFLAEVRTVSLMAARSNGHRSSRYPPSIRPPPR